MKRNTTLRLVHCALGCAALLVVSAQAGTEVKPSNGNQRGSASTGSLQLVSANASGVAANASSTTCAVSADGNLVLFWSSATNLVPGDTNGVSDLFLKNLSTGSIDRVTTQSNGAQIATGGDCNGTTMTPDGRLVAFNASNREAVFVKDTETGLLTQATPPVGTLPQVIGFFGGALSDDGTKLVFMTQPQARSTPGFGRENLIPRRLMLRDLSNGNLVTLATDNGITADGEVLFTGFDMSPDGTQVAFSSSSASLVPGDINGRPDVFVRNLVDGSTALVSTNSAGDQSNASGYRNPRFASNTMLAFNTQSLSNLGDPGLYLRDLNDGELTLVLANAEGGAADARLSGDARQVAFTRLYRGFNARVFVRELATGDETLASASASGRPSNGNSNGRLLSRDGTWVVFGSSASNLVSPRPPSNTFQVYIKDISAP